MFSVRGFVLFALSLLCQCFLWYLLLLSFSLLSLVFWWWCLHLWFLILFLSFLTPGLSHFVISLLFLVPFLDEWFCSFTSPVWLFSCNSLRDVCVSSLRASSYLSVFSCISLRELFMPFLYSSIIIMRPFRCDGISRICYGGRSGCWWCQVTLVSVAYVLMRASCHLPSGHL